MGANIGDVVELNAFEQNIAEQLANLRFNNNRKNGVIDRQMGKQKSWETELAGVGGELSFCRLFNVCPDFSIEPRSAALGTDNKKDAILVSHVTDVKGTTENEHNLLARPVDSNYDTHIARCATDLFALMTGPYPRFTFRGFLPKTVLLQARRIRNLGHGPTYFASQAKLYNAGLKCPHCDCFAPVTDFLTIYMLSKASVSNLFDNPVIEEPVYVA